MADLLDAVAKKHKHKKTCKSQTKVCQGKCGTVTFKCHKRKKNVECFSCCDVCASGCPFSSLQAAIDAASPGDTITVCPGNYTEAITIAKDLTIVGDDAVLRGTGADRVVSISAGTVVLETLRITGGKTASIGGGIFTSIGVTLSLTDCSISGNTSIQGGGICNFGTLEMTGCTVSDNSAGSGPGGGIDNRHALQMTDCTVSGNRAFEGGGIFNNSDATLSNCAVSGNTAPGDGGGIRNDRTMTLKAGTTVSENSANLDGGGIDNRGTLTLSDSTVSGNTAFINGGGIDNGGTVTLNNSSVSDNTAIGGGSGNGQGGGIFTGGAAACSGGSSVSGNTPNDCVACCGGSCDSC